MNAQLDLIASVISDYNAEYAQFKQQLTNVMGQVDDFYESVAGVKGVLQWIIDNVDAFHLTGTCLIFILTFLIGVLHLKNKLYNFPLLFQVSSAARPVQTGANFPRPPLPYMLPAAHSCRPSTACQMQTKFGPKFSQH